MAAAAVDRYAYTVPVSREWTVEHDALRAHVIRSTTADLVHVLDPSAQIPYIPQHNLPTPPQTSPVLAPLDLRSHPALERVSDTPVHEMIQAIVADKDEDEAAFFAADLSAVYEAVQMWRASALGERVEIFYAIKCNPSPVVLHFLSLLGLSFDCASASEVNQVLSLPAKPDPRRIIFANPCKAPSHIRQAAQGGVDMMTFDNADELYKVKRTHPTAKLVLRILTDDSKSLCRLGLKYGAPLSTCPGLLATAKQLGLNVVGVSFHVGSGCKDPAQFSDAFWRAKKVFNMAKEAGYDFSLLDIGGGFERETFAQMSEVVRDALDVYFPAASGVRVIAEPGRFLVSSAFTLATSIIARRRAHMPDEPVAGPSTPMSLDDSPADAEGEGEGADVMYYINDGVYGAFNCIMFDHQIVHPYPL
uniref:ornithine decarboxylase n=1 Tax=Tremella fuciformis TaxID=64657 RepID=D5KXY7_9TREE|nr:unknown [Tremella fuciformis]